jgi:hypothetical protein
MNFQEKIAETSSDLRARATRLASAALDVARARADIAAKRVDILKTSFAALSLAGRELNKVARRHGSRFVKENSAIAVAASKDLGAFARTTYASLAGRKATTKPRKRATATRKRATAKAA